MYFCVFFVLFLSSYIETRSHVFVISDILLGLFYQKLFTTGYMGILTKTQQGHDYDCSDIWNPLHFLPFIIFDLLAIILSGLQSAYLPLIWWSGTFISWIGVEHMNAIYPLGIHVPSKNNVSSVSQRTMHDGKVIWLFSEE